MSIINENKIIQAIGIARLTHYRILTEIEAERPITGRVTWPQPLNWQPEVGDDLFFEIFKLNKSGNWKVSLIIKASHNDPIIGQLRKVECLFLKTVFDWELPRPRNGIKTMAIYKKVIADENCLEDEAIKRGFDEIERVLRHKTQSIDTSITSEWQGVLDRVKA